MIILKRGIIRTTLNGEKPGSLADKRDTFAFNTSICYVFFRKYNIVCLYIYVDHLYYSFESHISIWGNKWIFR